MWQTESSVTIGARAEDLYGYLADLRRHGEWSIGVAEIVQTKGAGPEVGAEYRAEEKVPLKFTSYSRLTALEPPRRIEWLSWDVSAMEAEWALELTPHGGDSTLLVQRATFRPQSVVGRLMLVLMRKRQIPRENARSLERIKQAVESGAAARARFE